MSKRDDESLLQTVFNRLQEATTLVYDAETSGLDFKRNHIVGHVLTFGPKPQDSYYLPVRHAGGGNLNGHLGPQTATGWDRQLHPFEVYLLDYLSNPDLLIVGHYLNFDLKFLWGLGYTDQCARYEDTSMNAVLLNELQGKFNLSFCANAAGVTAKKGEMIAEHIRAKFPDLPDVAKNEMGHYWRLAGDDPIAVEYAVGDGESTWQLREWQQPKLAEEDLLKVHEIECRMLPVLVRMTAKGIKVDEDRLEIVRHSLETQIGQLMEKFPPDFNARSPGDVAKWCSDRGVTDWPLTPKSRKPSFPEAWLETNEPGRLIIEVRRLTTILTSFVMPLKETHLFNGRVHADFNQLRGDEYGTITGRLSSSNPNLQQVPKRNKALGRLFRSIFIPDTGMLWGSADYSQCEPRLLAIYSRSPVLLNDFRNNPDADAHQAVATAARIDRDTGKRVNQTLLTGGGKGVLITKYKLEPAAVDKIWDDYFKAMPEIKTLQQTAGYKMKMRGYIASLLGRRARLQPGKHYVAVNRLLQCGNADIMKLKMVQIDDYLKSVGRPVDMLASIHDAGEFQFWPETRHHYEKCLDIMVDFGPGQPIVLDIPMKVDSDEGKNWADATYGVEKVNEAKKAA